MAVTVVTIKMAGGVNYTHTTDTSADWPSVPNDTYFYDLDTEIVYYKDAAGTVINGYEEGGLTTIATDGTTIIGDGTSSSPLIALGSGTSGNLLISGGAVYSGTGLDFDVSPLEYSIAGAIYTSAATTVTLNPGDPADPRFDAIVVDEFGTVSVIQGTPAVTPNTPAVGEDQVLVQYVLVGAAATTPSITTEYVYREGSSPDWTPSVFGNNTTANFSSPTPTPQQGTECVLADIGRYGYTRGVRFATGTPVSRTDYVQLSFWVYLTVDLIAAGRTRGYVFAYADNTPVTADYIGFARWDQYCDFSLVGQWQLVSIPTGLFTANLGTNTTIGFLNFTLWPNLAGYAPTEIAFDNIKLSTGFGPTLNAATIDVLENDTIIGDTARLNFIDGTDTIVTVTDDTTNNKVDVAIDRPFEVRDGGSAFEPTISGINFTGAGVSLSTPGGSNPLITVNIPGGGGGGVASVTGLDTDNTDPLNPIVQIAVDGVSITGSGTPADPLVSTAGASGVFGIANAAGVYTYYSSLAAAIAAATVGQTIQLFTDYTETSSVSVFMKNGVDINLNGHTYEYATADINDTLSDGGIPATVTIFNGTLKRTGSSAPTTVVGVGLKLSNNSTKVTLHGVTVIAEDGSNCCIVQGGKLSGGYFRQIGSTTGSANAFLLNGSGSIADNIHVHADNLFSRIDLGKISNSYFRNDGARAVYLNSGEGYNITGYSTAGEGILVGAAKLYNSTGRSTVSFGISTSTASEIYNCSGYSSGASGISNSNYAENCVGSSAALYGIFTGSNSKTYNCTGRSSSLYGIFSRGLIVKTSAISTYNNPLGHGFGGVENNDEIIDCYAEVANASAYGVNAPTTSPYVTGFSGKGMTQLLNLLSNAQTNTEDNFGNILIG